MRVIYTYGQLNKNLTHRPTDGFIKATEGEWTVDEQKLYGYLEYNRPLTQEEMSVCQLVCMGGREAKDEETEGAL